MIGTRISKAIILVLIVVFMVNIPGMVLAAADETPPVIPPDPDITPVPTSPPSGGASSGGPYSPPAFQPYVEPLLSSDGAVVGNLTGRDYSTVLLWANKNVSIGGTSYDVSLAEQLSQKPSDCRLDLNILPPDKVSLPAGMKEARVLAKVNITKYYRYTWGLKPGTQKMALAVGNAVLDDNPDYVYYCVRYDGSDYLVQNIANPVRTDGRLVFTLTPTADDGTFTFVSMNPAMQAAVPAPAPSVEPVVPSYVPARTGDGQFVDGVFNLAIVFVAGNIIGMVILFIVLRIFD